MTQLLEVKNLVTSFRTAEGKVQAVRDISFSVDKEETLCIVGESGCGKSITSLSLMGLLPNNGEITSGSIKFKEEELTAKTEEQMRRIRGNEISMIFQEPMTALNPVFTIGFQLMEPLKVHTSLSNAEVKERAVELLDQVGIPDARKKLSQYPHELSGGMRQRVMIAMALACSPSLLIADEPTTALDVTIQAQILELMDDLKREYGMGMIMVTHDMGVVAEVADRVMVMYAGKVVETGTVEEIFNDPSYPYTRGLLASVPNIDDLNRKLEAIPGSPPSLTEKIPGCRFHPRCEFAGDKCIQEEPPMYNVSSSHHSKCWLEEKKEVPVGNGNRDTASYRNI
ncbi:ABC transporter ATP-binding protein [Halobacillus sp. Marseille-Q1614]|uniref:ABC transporter ATP-binding protein n=1 Tax=Halobacillus sp. Marseille-Q1614 TaxID=2709134 RepID=UPI00156D57F1|nr:ABC transporter ATP-binding protein [Halobacillus sp. Marseille-Q1614]